MGMNGTGNGGSGGGGTWDGSYGPPGGQERRSSPRSTSATRRGNSPSRIEQVRRGGEHRDEQDPLMDAPRSLVARIEEAMSSTLFHTAGQPFQTAEWQQMTQNRTLTR